VLGELDIPFTRTSFGGLDPEDRGPEDHKALAKSSGRSLNILDAHLASHRYVAGDTPTMGDVAFSLASYQYFNIESERPNLRHLTAWYKCRREHPGYQKRIMMPFGNYPRDWLELERGREAEGR